MPRLTELSVARAAAKPGERHELADGLVPGLQLRVGERGKSWTLLFRARGKQRRLKLGTWPTIGLADARKLAKAALLKVAAGEDPADDAPRPATFEAVELEFIERHIRRRHKRPQDVETILRRLAPWHGRPIGSITRADVLRVLDAELDAGHQRTANKLLGLIRQLFAWAIERGLAESNPALGIRRPGQERSRDRVLSDAELAAIWHAAGTMGWPWSGLISLLILTGLRRDEVADLSWSEIDLERRILVLPAARTKSGRPQTTALNALAVETIEALPRLGDRWVFPARSGRPISGFSQGKARLDALSGVTGWRLHDLRRSAASGMAKLGVTPQALARVLNHSARAGLPGVLSIYNRHSYDSEARAALDAWGRELARIIGRAEPKVVRLPRAS
jgi:integrase